MVGVSGADSRSLVLLADTFREHSLGCLVLHEVRDAQHGVPRFVEGAGQGEFKTRQIHLDAVSMLPHRDDGSVIGDAFCFRVPALEATGGGHVKSHAP